MTDTADSDGTPTTAGTPSGHGPVAGLVLTRELVSAGVGLLVLAVLGFVTWTVVHDDPSHARVGDLLSGSSLYGSTPARHRTTLAEPWGLIEVTVTDGVSSLPRDVAEQFGNLRPPEHGRWVAVEWTTTSNVGSAVVAAPFVRTHLALIVGDRTVPLDTASVAADPCPAAACVGSDSNVSEWVAVPSNAHPLVRAEFAGAAQTVDPRTQHRRPGLAAPLYPASSSQATGSVECDAPRLPAGITSPDDDGECRASVTVGPYLPGRGWAPAGQQWVGVDPDVRTPYSLQGAAGAGQPEVDYRSTDQSPPVTVAVAGATPVGPLAPAGTDLTSTLSAYAGAQVFSIASSAQPGAVTLSTTATYVPEVDDTAPAAAARTIPLSWTVPA